ncbi:MAG: glutathione S-transferase family protein [Burkholderiales bacterium]
MKLELYYAPKTCALVPYVALTEAGAEFTVHNMNSRSGQLKTPEYLKLNPKHKVPVLVIDGKPLTENPAIQMWIHRNFPKARLLPADPQQEIQAISLMCWFASGIHPKMTPNARPDNYCDLPDSAESVKRVANKLLFEEFKIADKMLAGREYFFDHFTTPDAYFHWCMRRTLSFKLDLSGFPNCMAHYRRLEQRPSVQKLIAHEKAVDAEFARTGQAMN